MKNKVVREIPVIKLIVDILKKDNKPTTSKGFFIALSPDDEDLTLINVGSTVKRGADAGYLAIDGTTGTGRHVANLFILGHREYIHKDKDHKERQKDNKEQHDANRYIMSCMAR